MDFIAYGQVENQIFAYDKRTGQLAPQVTQLSATQLNATQLNATQLNDIQIFKPVMCVIQVTKKNYNFVIMLMNQGQSIDYDFPKLNPETNMFYNFTYDPRIIIPALLKQQQQNDKPQSQPSHGKPESQPSHGKPESQPLQNVVLARCIIGQEIITYDRRSGKEIYNQKCNTLPVRCSSVNHIVNIERRNDKFIIEIQTYDLTSYDNIIYYPTTDIFGDCLHDPRIIIPAIRNNPQFAGYFKSFNTVDQKNYPVVLNSPDICHTFEDPKHIKYVDIQGIRVVYDSKTGQELTQQMQGMEKLALHVDECNGLLCEDFEFIVFFQANNTENVCRAVYNYHTDTFTGLTADPRIIIPYIRMSSEFNEYIKSLQIKQERKKLTDDMRIKDYFKPHHVDNLDYHVGSLDYHADIPDVNVDSVNSQSPLDPEVIHAEPYEDDHIDQTDPADLADQMPEVNEWSKRILHDSYDIRTMFSHLSMPTAEEIQEEREQKEIEEFEQMSADSQNKILLQKIEIIRSKLRAKQTALQQHYETPEENIIVEPFAPPVKFTPRENNIYVCTTWLDNIKQPTTQQAHQA